MSFPNTRCKWWNLFDSQHCVSVVRLKPFPCFSDLKTRSVFHFKAFQKIYWQNVNFVKTTSCRPNCIFLVPFLIYFVLKASTKFHSVMHFYIKITNVLCQSAYKTNTCSILNVAFSFKKKQIKISDTTSIHLLRRSESDVFINHTTFQSKNIRFFIK